MQQFIAYKPFAWCTYKLTWLVYCTKCNFQFDIARPYESWDWLFLNVYLRTISNRIVMFCSNYQDSYTVFSDQIGDQISASIVPGCNRISATSCTVTTSPGQFYNISVLSFSGNVDSSSKAFVIIGSCMYTIQKFKLDYWTFLWESRNKSSSVFIGLNKQAHFVPVLNNKLCVQNDNCCGIRNLIYGFGVSKWKLRANRMSSSGPWTACRP